MKNKLITLFSVGILLSQAFIFSAFQLTGTSGKALSTGVVIESDPGLKAAALEVLKTKCNVCHRKQNPFKIFSQKNMDKHAPKIYKQVFVKRRMPKGDKIKLTEQEYETLKNWLKTKNIF